MIWREVSIRFSYLFRSYMPHGIVGSGGALYLIFRSLSANDLSGLKEIAWSEFLHGDWESAPSLDWIMTQLTTINAATKAMLAITFVVIAFYASDVCTTGRKPGWCLISSYGNTGRWSHFKVWATLGVGTLSTIIILMTLIYRQATTSMTAFKIAITTDLIALTAFMFINRSFESWQLRWPEIQDLREKRRFERQKTQDSRRQHNAVAEQRRSELRDVQSQIAEKERQIEGANREVRALQSSGHDTSLTTEAIANLQQQKSQLNSEIQQLYQNIPGRS